MRNRFRLAYAAVALAAAGLVAASYFTIGQTPTERARPAAAVSSGLLAKRHWGRVQAAPGLTVFTLGPVTDRRRRHEVTTDHVVFDYASLFVSNDGGRSYVRLSGEPMGRCGFHWQGFGMNAIVAIGRCVPLPDRPGGGNRQREWLRVENLRPVARLVVLRFLPRTKGDRFAPP